MQNRLSVAVSEHIGALFGLGTAGALTVGLVIASLGLAPRTAAGAPPFAARAEHPSSSSAGPESMIPKALPEIFAAQPAARAEILPNALHFGSIRVGATVEGSVRIFRQSAGSSGLTIKVEPPAFVRIGEINIGSQDYGGNVRGFCDISLSVDAQRAGKWSGEVRVEMGRQQVAIPVSATVRPQMPQLTRLLIVESPFTKVSTSDATMFEPLLKLIDDGHFDVHYLEILRGMPVVARFDLAKVDVVFLGMGGLVRLEDSDVTRLKQFVDRGGRVILAANHFFERSVGKANELLEKYGLRMKDTESPGMANVDIEPTEIKDDPLTEGVRKVHFLRPSPVIVTDAIKGKILVTVPRSPGEGFVAVARVGEGEIIALGQSLWWHWITTGQGKASDNAVLLGNLLKKSRKR